MSDIDEQWFGPETATFGDRVAGAREAAGMTQAQLARRLGIKKATLAGWEQDMSEPRANRLSMMAGVLNVSIMWLLTGEGDGATLPVDGEDAPQADALTAALAEMRAIRSAMRNNSERLARLEKRLREMKAVV